jgi:nicotinamidase-related amidase
MSNALIVVDVQNGFINHYTEHIPERVVTLIESGKYDPVLFTRFINTPGGPYHRFVDWHDCSEPPETDLVDRLLPFASYDTTFTKPGYAGIPAELAEYLQEHEIEQVSIVGIDTDMCVLKIALDLFDLRIEPVIMADCCASTLGLQAHFAGLAVLARNIGANRLRSAGLDNGQLGAP